MEQTKHSRPVTLVVGANGFIGSALTDHLERAGERVVGTTNHASSTGTKLAYLDLLDAPSRWEIPTSAGIAAICAGVSKLGVCSEKPELSHRVNVDGVLRLAERLVEEGVFIVYLSTDKVFDGSIPHRAPDSPYSPVTEYGRQKSLAEQGLGRMGDAVAIVRLSKVLGPPLKLFPSWIRALRSGDSIHPFSDMTLAPVPLSCVLKVLELVGRHRLPGIFQVSGQEDITYAEAAVLGAKSLGLDVSLVEPIRASEAGLSFPVSKYTTLNTERLKSTFGFSPPDAKWTIETAFTMPHLLTCVAQRHAR